MTSPQDRFILIDQPVMSPGKCLTCGLTQGDADRKFVDTGHDLDWYGVIYICTGCIREIANGLFYLSPDQAIKLRIDCDEAFQFNQELVTENEFLRSTVNSLSEHRCHHIGNSKFGSVSQGRKTVSSKEVNSGGKQNSKNAEHDASEGSSDPEWLEPGSDSDPLELLRI